MNQDIEARKQELLKEGYEEVYTRTKVLTDAVMHYCPGCGHGTTHRLIAEVIDEMGIQDNVVGVSPVGCSVLAYNYFDVDFQEAAHGRAPAVATAIKRLNPDTYVFTYRRDYPCRQPWREHDHDLRQQRYLRYDRWPDGPHHAGRHAQRHHTLWPPR